MEMVTRVAMAIASSQLDEGDGLYDWYALTEEVQDDFLATARAAIEAMRKPTEAMLDAPDANDFDLVEHGHIYDEYTSDPAALAEGAQLRIWQAMIDAALSPSGEK